MGWFATNLISAFLLPPFNLILLGTAGLLLLKWRPRLGKLLIAVTLALLYLLSTPFFAELMLQRLETRPPPGPFNSFDSGIQAIVVLGSGTYFDAPEYGGHTVSRFAWSESVMPHGCIVSRANLSSRQVVRLLEAALPKRSK